MIRTSRYEEDMNGHSMPSMPRSLVSRLTLVVAFALLVAACASTAEPETSVAATADTPIHGSAEDTPDLSRTVGPAPKYGSTLEEFGEIVLDTPEGTPPPPGFTKIEWGDLIPPGFSGQEISERFNERIAQVEPGSPEADEVFADLQAEYENQPVNPDLAGSEIQLAGFVAPLTYVDDLITEFLLVPYFGACIHVPPPPVNQTIMVNLQDGEGLTIDESWGAVWVTGTLTVDGAETDLATAGYSINEAQTGVYVDPI